MPEASQQSAQKKLIATVMAVVVIAGMVVLADALKGKTTNTTASSPVATQTGAAPTNGGKTYSDSESYVIPAGTESVKVSLSLKDGSVADVTVIPSKKDFTSAEYQNDFLASYKKQVVGQKISGLQINSVAGASDTTRAFNKALSKIASQAAA